MVERNVRGKLAALLSAVDDILALEEPDAILRRSVEVARKRVGLRRAAIFLYDSARDMMLGTWGTDLRGAIVDEHRIMYSLSDVDREAVRRAKEEGAHFTVFDDCPIIEHHGSETRIAGRGWVAWTPIVSARGIIGMLFNDVGLSGAPVDETKQEHAAILCSLLGTVLDPLRGIPGAGKRGVGETRARRMVGGAAAMLADDPTVETQEHRPAARDHRRLVHPHLQGGNGDVAARVSQPRPAGSRRCAARTRSLDTARGGARRRLRQLLPVPPGVSRRSPHDAAPIPASPPVGCPDDSRGVRAQALVLFSGGG